MLDEALPEPRRKCKAGLHPLESPFPVPIASIVRKPSSNEHWYYYFGSLKGDHVAVSRSGDLTFLYRLGFFGKGILSKSRPQFEKYGDVLSENARHKYVHKLNKLDEVQRDKKKKQFEEAQEERLRQHKDWGKNKVSERHKSEFVALGLGTSTQCLDLHADIDDKQLEELSSDSVEECDVEGELAYNVLAKRSLSPQPDVERKKLKLEDAYRVYEYLQLTLEEAFFLSYGLGCLSVKDESEVSLSLAEMWRRYSTLKGDFVVKYVAYHHFRSKGWVVRFVNNYGTDFILYKDGMPFYHASYSVIVCPVDSETLSSLDSQLSWKDISCVSRVNEMAAKEMLMCYVIHPKGITSEELSTPACIRRFKIAETIIRRWVPEKHRATSLP